MNNLYPCILPSHLPAFVVDKVENKYTGILDIPFVLSSFNTIDEIGYIEISLVDFSTNNTLFKADDYPNGTKIIPIDEIINTDFNVRILNTYLKNEDFGLNSYIKMQIRLIDRQVPTPPPISEGDPQRTASWIQQNLAYFSEWSTVCLLYSISQPTLTLKDFSKELNWISGNETLILPNFNNLISGKLVFDIDDTETLKIYQITIYNENQDIVEKSSILYPINTNEIKYQLRKELANNQNYTLQVDIETRNFYTQTYTYNFRIEYNQEQAPDVDLVITPDEENGWNKLTITDRNKSLYGHYVIRRSSLEGNFEDWDDLYIFNTEQDSEVKRKIIDTTHHIIVGERPPRGDSEYYVYSWYDNTFESGKFYKYALAKINKDTRGLMTIIDQPVVNMCQHMYLLGDNKQLCLKFDPQISSFKKNILEQKNDTLGSKYPFVNRNANTEYKSFSINGTISYLMDCYETMSNYQITCQHKFFKMEDILDSDSMGVYKDYNNDNRILETNNFIYEKEFRDRVIDFLYSDNIKLLRTPTEGNLLVKLMDISLTPKRELGRMIYEFSGTVIEVEDCTFENIKKNNIVNVGLYSDIINTEYLVNQEFLGVTIYTGTSTYDIDILEAIEDTLGVNSNNYNYLIEKLNIDIPTNPPVNINQIMNYDLIIKYNNDPTNHKYKIIPGYTFVLYNLDLSKIESLKYSISGTRSSNFTFQVTGDVQKNILEQEINIKQSYYQVRTIGQYIGSIDSEIVSQGLSLYSLLGDKYAPFWKLKNLNNFSIVIKPITTSELDLEMQFFSKDGKIKKGQYIGSVIRIRPDSIDIPILDISDIKILQGNYPDISITIDYDGYIQEVVSDG